MVTVAEASQIVLQNTVTPGVTLVPFEAALNRILAKSISADRDLPPFNRVTMDGIAIASTTWLSGQRTFTIEAMQAAGEPAKRLTNKNNAVEVMTGAMLPEGTDTVIRYEDLNITDGVATVSTEHVSAGQNIHRRASDARAGETLLTSPFKLSAAEIAVLASIGTVAVPVFVPPTAAIVSGGDELVPVDSIPEPHQVRRSNSYAIMAAMQRDHWPATIHHMRDDQKEIHESLTRIVAENDVIILSGGVSKGKFDFVPSALESLGFQKLIHEVSQRPGKPLLFARKGQKTVFALPGNPVSTFMCYHRYVRPWFYRCMGLPMREEWAILDRDFKFEPRLTYFLQVQTTNIEGKLMATPYAGGGSGDFANLKDVDGFLELPLEKTHFSAGEAYPFIAFR